MHAIVFVLVLYLLYWIMVCLSMSIYVTKADGSRQMFDKEKVIKTCLRMGANRKIAEEVAQSVEGSLYDGISTEKILSMIFRFLENHKPAIRHLLDLRKGLSLMNSKPEFERFFTTIVERGRI